MLFLGPGIRGTAASATVMARRNCFSSGSRMAAACPSAPGRCPACWSGSPASVKLGELDVICAVLGCGIEELLLPEPGTVAGPAGEEQHQQAAAPAVGSPAVTPRRRDHPHPAAALRWARPRTRPATWPAAATDCLAWGVMEQIRCRACRSFRDGNRAERACTGCGRALRVKNGYCRLCWVQLSGGRAWEGTAPQAVAVLAAAGVKIGHQQLFFDRMAPRTGAGPARAAPRRPRRVFPPQAAWVQPGLPSPHARTAAPPASPSLAAAVRVADRLAETRGWSGEIRRRVRQGLAIALDGHHEGQDVGWSRALPALRARRLCAGHVAEALRQAGLLDDDRRPAFDAWLDRKLGGVSAGIRRDAERWLRTLKNGSSRSRPRSIATVHSHLGKALPALLDWSARYHHLREVTRDDIQDHVRPCADHNAITPW